MLTWFVLPVIATKYKQVIDDASKQMITAWANLPAINNPQLF